MVCGMWYVSTFLTHLTYSSILHTSRGGRGTLPYASPSPLPPLTRCGVPEGWQRHSTLYVLPPSLTCCVVPEGRR